jgi:hypothetical protein
VVLAQLHPVRPTTISTIHPPCAETRHKSGKSRLFQGICEGGAFVPGWGVTRYDHNGSATLCVMAWIWFQFNTDVSMLCPTLLHLLLNAGVGDDAARVRLVLQALRALPAATMR